MHDSSPDTDPAPTHPHDRLDLAWLDLPEAWRGGPRALANGRGLRMISRGHLSYYRAQIATEHRGEQDDDLVKLYWRVCATPSMVLPPERSAKERMRER